MNAESLSIENKVGTLLMAPLYADSAEDLVARFRCGSFLTWGGGFGDTAPDSIAKVCAMNNRIQDTSLRHRGVPVWLHGCPCAALDGRQDRWLYKAVTAGVEPERVKQAAGLLGRRWRALGIHNTPEPTLNVFLFDTGILRETRISDDAETVRIYGNAFNRGTLAVGCGTMAQHFPAHGATPLDSHDAYPVVELARDELWPDHMLPYQECFDDGCTTICTAHLACPALDSDPKHIATTSKPILTDVLRGEMNFDGITIADAIEMKGFQKNGPIEKIVVDAVNAGCDSICMVAIDNVEPVFNSLLAAVKSGAIPDKRLDEAVQRNMDFLRWLDIADDPHVDATAAARVIEELDHDPAATVLTGEI
jgi:beta-N-acetylhexosaminidase